jgi:hypothetical protein
MRSIKSICTIVFLLITKIIYPQAVIIQGQVSDRQGNNLMAVNAYLLHQNTIGNITDLNGRFVLKIPNSLAGGMLKDNLQKFKEKFLENFNSAVTENALKG